MEKSERQTQDQDQRCQSGQSAGGDSSKNCGADQQRLQISDLHFDKFSTPATVACWKIRFKTEVCTCSQFFTEAVHWIKEVEMVDSVDDLISSSSIRGIRMPNFEVLDARIASALNKIIHNTQFRRKVSLEEQKAQKEDRFLRGRQIAYLIYEYFRVTGANDSVENYADLFTVALPNDSVPSDDMLEGSYKLRIRESEKLSAVLELYDLEIHQKKLGPDDHRLKTMVKRSIELDIRNKNFGARSGNYERNAVVKNPGTKQRVQRILGDCWQWESNGQCSLEETIAVSVTISISVHKQHSRILLGDLLRSRMSENASRTRSPRGKSPSGRMSRWRPARITSKEPAPIHSVKSGTLQNTCFTSPGVVADLGKSARMHIVRLMNSRLKGPKRMMTKVQ